MKLSKGLTFYEKIIVFIFKLFMNTFFSTKTIAQIFGDLVKTYADMFLYYFDLVRFYKTKRDLLSKIEIAELLKNIKRFEDSFLDEGVESHRDFMFHKDKTPDFRIVTIYELIDFYSINLKRFVFLCNFKNSTYAAITTSIDEQVEKSKRESGIRQGTMDFLIRSFRGSLKKNWMYHYHLKISEKIKIYESIKKENLNRPSNFF